MNMTISVPTTIPLRRRRRLGFVVAFAALLGAVACALAFTVDWNSTSSHSGDVQRVAELQSAGGWSGLADPKTGIPLSAGIVDLPDSVVQLGITPDDRTFDRSASASGSSISATPDDRSFDRRTTRSTSAVLQSAGGWSGLVDPKTGIPLSAGIVGLPDSAVQVGISPDDRPFYRGVSQTVNPYSTLTPEQLARGAAQRLRNAK
jgi:hypothetical protein